MKIFGAAVVTAGLMALSIATVPNAWAAVITVNSISGEWTNVVGGSYVTNNGAQSNPTAAQLRWGGGSVPAAPQSGYDFLSVAPPAFDASDGAAFSVGTFTHHNNPIPLSSRILSAQLDVLVNIDGSGGTGPFQFLFDHNETPNSCSPAPDCANDIVTISNLTASDTFMLGDQLFLLGILGFSIDGGNTFTNIFSSPEGGSNSAQLYAQFISPVPLPAAVWMFLTGLAGLAGFRLRRRGKATATA